ncbi:MAG: dihydroorotate dehydrogenase electron transfer subunit [Clostridia bacterium]|nr:dihydroorotate dehydrogenase electron transfer subunit [Clostridia bacterium]
MKKISVAGIKENMLIAPDIYRMELELSEDINALPGQFVNVYLDDGAHLLPRPISICRAEDNRLTLVYRAVGVGTKIMAGLTEGDTLRVSDPLGNGFTLPESGTVLLVGGGVGVPPMLGTAIAAKAKGLNVIAAHGYRSELFLKEEFERVGQLLIATDDGSAGYHGTVVELLRSSDIPADTTVLSCGPKPMLKALVQYCEEKGLPVQVSLEERMGCGFGACVGCVCKLNQNGNIVQKRVCKDGPVFNGSEVIF